MNTRLIYAIPYLVVGILSLRDWRKYNSDNFLWYTCLSAVGFSAELIYYFLIACSAPPNVLSFAQSFFYVFDPILIVVVGWIVVRRLMQK